MKNKKLIDKLCLIIVSILTILMGVIFIVQVMRIYYGNDKTYTREICAKFLLQMLPIIILWVISVIGSFVYFRIKNTSKKEFAKITYATKLQNLEAICNYNEQDYELVNKEKKKIKIAMIINIVIVCLCSIMSLGYLLNVKHFDSSGDLTKQAIDMGIHLLPWVVIAFGSMIGATIYEEVISKKLIELVKQIIKNNGRKEMVKYEPKNKLAINIARGVILGLSMVLIVVGIFDGSVEDVLQKAINICTECIGLG